MELWGYSQVGSWVGPQGETPLRSHLAKACGQMLFPSDLKLPGMLVGRALRSPYAHCQINHIDVRPALAVPGVHAVLTARDIPGDNIVGKTVKDQPILAADRARTVMDALAIVAAETEEAAQEALEAIELDLTPLPAVFDPEEALRPGAPSVHPRGNLLADFQIVHGDAEAAMAQADVIVENSYRFPWVEHAFLETEAVVAAPSEDGTITVWLGCHNIYGERTVLARAFGWSPTRFRVVLVPPGGSFGGKDDNIIPTWAALLAWRTGRPVRFHLSRRESIRGHSKYHPYLVHHCLGAQADGRLVAAIVDIVSDTGAYAHWGEGMLRFVCLHATGPYRMPHAYVRGRLVYTNNIVAGAMRAWGTPGVEFAMESQMDILAERLGMHPLRLRWLNALRDGDETITGRPVPPGCRLRETIAAAARYAGLDLGGED
ncbi:MAG: xanthine dehydrogenase family protein molybdopterin-binding subunit [Anaerolineae bacterium]